MKNVYRKKDKNSCLLIDLDLPVIHCLAHIKTQERVSLQDGKQFLVHESLEKTLKHIKTEYSYLKHCAIALPHSAVMMKILSFSAELLEDDIRSILQLDLKKQFDSDEPLYFDLEPLTGMTNDMISYRVVVAKALDVMRYISPIKHAGFIINAINVESLLLEKLISSCYQYDGLLIVFFFKKSCQLHLVLRNNKILSAQEVLAANYSVAHCTQSIQRFLKLCSEQYSIVKKTVLILGENSKAIVSSLLTNYAEINFLDNDLIWSNLKLSSLICLGLAVC